jgi:hypothetical protein
MPIRSYHRTSWCASLTAAVPPSPKGRGRALDISLAELVEEKKKGR